MCFPETKAQNKEAPSSGSKLIRLRGADTPKPITISAFGEGTSSAIVSKTGNKNK